MSFVKYKVEIALGAITIALLAIVALGAQHRMSAQAVIASECDRLGGVLLLAKKRAGRSELICFDKSAILYMKDPK